METPPAGQQGVPLRLQVPAGTVLVVQQRDELELQLGGGGGGAGGFGAAGQQMSQRTVQPADHVMEVLKGSPEGGGAPGEVRVRFAPDQQASSSENEAPANRTTPAYAGKTYTVRQLPGVPMQIDPAPANDEVRQVLSDVAGFIETDLAPGRPVAVGERWSVDTTRIRQDAGMEPGGRLDMTATLAGLDTSPLAGGRPVANLDLALQWDGRVQGLQVSGPQRGRAVLDLGTGLALELVLEGTLQLEVQQPDGSRLEGSLSLNSRRQATELKPGGMAGGAGDGPGGAAGNGGSGATDPAAGPANPFGGGEAAPPARPPGGAATGVPPFAGTFTGEDLSVTLIEGEQRRIRVQRGEVSAMGRLTGNREIDQSVEGERVMTTIRFQGVLEHEGAEFPFSALQPNPEVMEFTTGGSTQRLERQPPEEPKGPSNPFG